MLLTGGHQPCMTAICSCPCERCSSQGIGSRSVRCAVETLCPCTRGRPRSRGAECSQDRRTSPGRKGCRPSSEGQSGDLR